MTYSALVSSLHYTDGMKGFGIAAAALAVAGLGLYFYLKRGKQQQQQTGARVPKSPYLGGGYYYNPNAKR